MFPVQCLKGTHPLVFRLAMPTLPSCLLRRARHLLVCVRNLRLRTVSGPTARTATPWTCWVTASRTSQTSQIRCAGSGFAPSLLEMTSSKDTTFRKHRARCSTSCESRFLFRRCVLVPCKSNELMIRRSNPRLRLACRQGHARCLRVGTLRIHTPRTEVHPAHQTIVEGRLLPLDANAWPSSIESGRPCSSCGH